MTWMLLQPSNVFGITTVAWGWGGVLNAEEETPAETKKIVTLMMDQTRRHHPDFKNGVRAPGVKV